MKILRIRYGLLLTSIIIIVLEALPLGVIMYFSTGPGNETKETFSYFSVLPVGYANVGPFITAIFSCILFVLTAAYAVSENKKFIKIISIACPIAILTSALPLMFGMRSISIINIIVTGCFILMFVVSRCICYRQINAREGKTES